MYTTFKINVEVQMDRIRQLRKERGLSQAKLAVMADMDPATLNRLERGTGNPNLKTLERVANVLEVGVANLLGKAQAPLPSEEATGGGALDYWTLYLTHLADHFEDLAGEEVEPCRRYGWGDVAPGVAGDALTVVEALLDGVRDGTVVATTAAVRSALRAGFRLAKAADRIDELAAPSEEDLMQGVRRRQDQALTEIRFRQIVEALEDVVSEEDREAIFS